MAREEGQEVYLEFLWGHLSEKDHFEDLAVDRGIILKWILTNWIGGYTLDLSDSWQRQVPACCEQRSAPPCSTQRLAEDQLASQDPWTVELYGYDMWKRLPSLYVFIPNDVTNPT